MIKIAASLSGGRIAQLPVRATFVGTPSPEYPFLEHGKLLPPTFDYTTSPPTPNPPTPPPHIYIHTHTNTRIHTHTSIMLAVYELLPAR